VRSSSPRGHHEPEKSLVRASPRWPSSPGFPEPHELQTYPSQVRSLDEAAYLTAPAPAVPIRALPDLSHQNLKVEVQGCVETFLAWGSRSDDGRDPPGAPHAGVYVIIPAPTSWIGPGTPASLTCRQDPHRSLDGRGPLRGSSASWRPSRAVMISTSSWCGARVRGRPEKPRQVPAGLELEPPPRTGQHPHPHRRLPQDQGDYRTPSTPRKARTLDPGLKEIYNSSASATSSSRSTSAPSSSSRRRSRSTRLRHRLCEHRLEPEALGTSRRPFSSTGWPSSSIPPSSSPATPARLEEKRRLAGGQILI